ncbi:N-acetylglucosamine-6-phosphate deacetylase [Niallia sp. 03133]|uniref:N-acetylglucosamine-6-phosphate deacetylase n=1 Tax=Niallia sp. 03133 TaxID=3458060 RepID=UPI004044A960
MTNNNETSILFQEIAIYIEDRIINNGYLVTKNGAIDSYGEMAEYKADTIQADQIFTFEETYKLIPGMVDIHIHGANDADVMDAALDSLNKMANILPKEGTTSFLATTMTQGEQEIEAALKNAADYIKQENQAGKAEIVGIHLEGPFINAKRAGAQPLEAIQKPDIDLFIKWQNIAEGNIRLVTMAPEEENGLNLIAHLKETDVVPSMGHTDAIYEEVKRGMEAGVIHVTHLYNGMRGLHHRDPGAAGASLLHKELTTEIIVDGIHIHPEVVNLTFQQKGKEGIILITDSMRAKWLEDGISSLGGQKVIVKSGKALLENGSLAGSTLKMNDAITNMMSFTGCSLEDAVYMGAYNPARQIGILDRKGSIQSGKDADLVVLNGENKVVMTICRGQIAFHDMEGN